MLVKLFSIPGAFLLAVVAAQPAHSAVNLVQNGDFETVSKAGSYEFGDRYTAEQVANWSTSGYNFVFAPGTADTTGATGESGNLQLYGPGNGSANGLTATSPTGGNFIAADGAYNTAAITQTINGLVVGWTYQLSFYWAAAQQKGYSGSTTENWTVGFGNQTYTTATVTTPAQGFVPWMLATTTFRATSTSQVLSFLAAGTPSGQPPFSLLDGVVLTAAPEPATWALLGLGAAACLIAVRRRPASATGWA